MNTSAAKYLIESLLEMPEFMEKAFAGLPVGLLTSQPEHDRSPLAEHAWHMRDCESDLYGMRIRMVLAEDCPYLEPMDIGDWPNERNYLTKPVAQAIHEFRSLREGLVEELRSVSANDLERRCKRASGTRSSVLDLVAEVLEHDQDHCKRVVAILSHAQASAA